MTDVENFVEEFFRRTIGVGKGCSPAGMSALMVEFNELPPDQKVAVLARIKQRGEYKQSCNLVSGKSPERLTSRGIRPHG